MKATFEVIRLQAEGDDAPCGMFQYTMAAYDNAQTTIFEEKEAAEDQFDAIALASLETILCDSFIPETDAVAHDYFASLGVKW